jgi:fimbrial chaperone protein
VLPFSRSLMAALLACSFIAPAGAAALHVTPVNLRLEVGQQAVGMTLSNVSNRPLTAQVRVFAWSQGVSEDILNAQQEVVASPPIVSIAAGGEQFVRVVRIDHAPADKELTYRLLIDELPDPTAASVNGAVDIRLRYSIPLFIMPARAQPDASLKWELSQHTGAYFMKVTNTGGLHAQLSAVKLLQSDGTAASVSDGLLGYALAGNAREWRLPIDTLRSAQDLRFIAQVNGKPVEAKVALVQNDVVR